MAFTSVAELLKCSRIIKCFVIHCFINRFTTKVLTPTTESRSSVSLDATLCTCTLQQESPGMLGLRATLILPLIAYTVTGHENLAGSTRQWYTRSRAHAKILLQGPSPGSLPTAVRWMVVEKGRPGILSAEWSPKGKFARSLLCCLFDVGQGPSYLLGLFNYPLDSSDL